MAIYVVMEPPGSKGTEATTGAVLVRDAFALVAFLLPPLWLLWHRLWIEAALAFAAGVGLTALGEVAGLGLTGAALSLLVSLYVGLEGAALRLNALARRGWRQWGVVEAASRDEAEIRYVAGEVLRERAAEDVRPTPSTVPQLPRQPASGPALGLFSYPGKP